MNSATGTRLGVDVGGTFTDLVALVDGRVRTAKVPSTPADQSEGVLAAVRAGEVAGVEAFAHGMTVATNALLERRGARTALVTTAGFRDILEIGRQNRPHLYDLTQDRPPGLIPRELRFCVRERMGPEGELIALDEAGVRDVVARLAESGVDSVAVCLLFAFDHPEHERRVGEAIRAALPDVHVSLSCEVLPEFREYERFATTAADAYLAPKLAAYLQNLARKVVDADVPEPRVMQSSGGVVELPTAAALASGCVLSGPAGGVVGAAYVGEASGYGNLLTFDMGGTSTDVAPIVDGEAQTTTDAVVAGVPIRHPMVDVHTVSAGGGSIARADAGGALRVGPESAGAVPGPACYDRGGTEPTVTDANLFIGLLADGAVLGGGEVVLRRALAEQALSQVGRRLGLDALETALGVIRVADAEMVRALRVVSVERGLDPRDFALAAFGGAGGMHACSLAEELGMRSVLVPRASGVLSALGLAISDLRRDFVHPLIGGLDDLGRAAIEDGFQALEREAREALHDPQITRRADLRYRRQAFELTVDGDDLDALAERLHDAHERRYGYAMPEEPVELVALRLVAIEPVVKPPLREPTGRGDAVCSRREVHIEGEWRTVDVLGRDRMGSGSTVVGPAIVEFAEATCLVRPGWRGEVDPAGTLVLERD
ncbi:hydantoinase/oxoprolinase family protein [Candidatus Solirubrobacter pratensis]|uniref:hydantoinase/oxoprolinase family protein n=1 Tax=Candidatus Solirubrobacter pratensis TaxID=1298857 RepID=UPI0004243E73|nr:hydantoinase/oxoprolinase family protein [Candidatus Solirubrobacter pratensis]